MSENALSRSLRLSLVRRDDEVRAELHLRRRILRYVPAVGPVSYTHLAKAIRKGLADGSISPDVDVQEIYYNSYDAILGIMQRLSIGGTPSARELDYDSRMLHLSQMFVRALSAK